MSGIAAPQLALGARAKEAHCSIRLGAVSRLKILALLPLAAAARRLQLVVLTPAGDIAAQQRDLVIISTVLMLLIIVPVMALTVLFAWRYRQSNTAATLRARLGPFDQARAGDLGGAAADHHLPRRADLDGHASARSLPPLGRIACGPRRADRAPSRSRSRSWRSTGSGCSSIPSYGIATVNELAAPVDRPIDSRSPPRR